MYLLIKALFVYLVDTICESDKFSNFDDFESPSHLGICTPGISRSACLEEAGRCCEAPRVTCIHALTWPWLPWMDDAYSPEQLRWPTAYRSRVDQWGIQL